MKKYTLVKNKRKNYGLWIGNFVVFNLVKDDKVFIRWILAGGSNLNLTNNSYNKKMGITLEEVTILCYFFNNGKSKIHRGINEVKL